MTLYTTGSCIIVWYLVLACKSILKFIHDIKKYLKRYEIDTLFIPDTSLENFYHLFMFSLIISINVVTHSSTIDCKILSNIYLCVVVIQTYAKTCRHNFCYILSEYKNKVSMAITDKNDIAFFSSQRCLRTFF